MKHKVVPAQRLIISEEKKCTSSSTVYSDNTTRSKYELASEHIIIQRTLSQSWFSRCQAEMEEIIELSKLVDQLMKEYRDYFNIVIEREPWTERNCITDFKKITEEVLIADEDKYNWTRIAMLLALATRLAQYFYKNGATEKFVKEFSRCVGGCIEDRINEWGNKEDRWAALRNVSKENSVSFKYLFGAGAAVYGFLTTVVNFGRAAPVFIKQLKA